MPHCGVKANKPSNRRWSPLRAQALLVVALADPSGVAADALDVRHGGPFTGLFGLPSPAESVTLAPDTRWQIDYSLQGSSHAIGEVAGSEELLLDGESWRHSLRLRTRLGSRIEAGIELPWIHHSGGTLDDLIDGWHGALGLPDGIRDRRPKDELLFRYLDPAGQEVAFTRDTGGLGDIRLTGGLLLSRDERGSLAIRLGIELPTGDAAELTGSGGTDLSLGVGWERRAMAGERRWEVQLSAGLVRFGNSDLPVLATRNWGGWLHAGAGWYLTPRVELLGGIQAATSPIDSSLGAYEGGSLMLSLGAGFRLGRRYRLDLGFSEDINVESAPDIIFLLRLSRR